MAEETNKRMSTACAVSFTLYKVSFFVISALSYSGKSRWFKRVSTLLNMSTVSALNWNLRDIMTTATFLLLAFGVADATEDRVTDGKHIYPKVYY